MSENEEHVEQEQQDRYPARYPQEGTKKAGIWAELDRLDSTGELANMKRGDIVEHLVSMGFNRGSAGSDYQEWRKYYGRTKKRDQNTIRETVERICQEELELHGPEDLRRKHVIARTRQLGITDGSASVAWQSWKKANLEPLLESLGTEDEEG